MACARAAELLSLSVRQVKRLKKRLREQGEAALAHANRGRPSPRRLPARVRQAVVRLARSTYAGFNDHHLCEKLCEVEGFSLSRETLRRLLREAGLGSPRKRRAPPIVSAVCDPPVKANCCNSMARLTIGSKAAALVSPRSACKTMPPEKSWLLSSSPPNPPQAIYPAPPTVAPPRYPARFLRRSQRHLRPQRRLLVGRRTARWKASAHSVRPCPRTTRHHLYRRPQPASQRPRRTPLGRAPGSVCSELRLAQAADLDSANAVLRVFMADYNRRFARRPRDLQSAWRPAPENLERICCFVHQRVVSNDNIVQWDGQRLQIPQQGQRFSFAGAKVHIYQALDGRVSLYYGDTRLQHTLAPPG